MEAFLRRPGAGAGERPRPVPAGLGRLVLRLPGRHRDRQAARRGLRRCAARPAVANARLAYQHYEQVFGGDRWQALAAAGAKPQRPLWASTGVKDPAYDDTHVRRRAGRPRHRQHDARGDAAGGRSTTAGPRRHGHRDLRARRRRCSTRCARPASTTTTSSQVLEDEGLQKFEQSWNELIESVTEQLEKAGADVGPDRRHHARRRGPGRRRPRGERPVSSGARRSRSAGVSSNPLRDPRDRRLPRVPAPCALVVFGVTGDLARKKLIPAVYDLANRGPAAAGLRAARASPAATGATATSSRSPREAARRRAPAPSSARRPGSGSSEAIRFLPGSFDDDDGVRPARRDAARAGRDATARRATPRSTCPSRRRRSRPCCRRCSAPGWPTTRSPAAGGGWSSRSRSARTWRQRAGAQQPWSTTSSPPQDVFRIDHYLGKETVQNLLALRFANELFEPIWNRHHIDSVQITMAEDVGIGSRAALLRADRRRPRRAAEPPAAAARADRDGGARQLRRREPAHREAQGARRGRCRPRTWPATPSAASTTRAGWPASGSRLPRRGGRRPEEHAPRPTPRSGWRSRAGAGPGCRSTCAPASGSPAGSPRSRCCSARRRCCRSAHTDTEELGQQPARRAGPARRGHDAAVRLQGARHPDGGPRRRDGLPLRRGVHRELAPRRTSGCCSTCCSATPRCSRATRRSRRAGGSSTRSSELLGRARRGRPAALPRRRVGPAGRRRDARPRRPRLATTVTPRRP